MKYTLLLLIAILFFSCNNTISDENNGVFDVDNFFLISCEQLLDTAGVKLYPFVPFTDEEMRAMSYDYKLERRQIPEDFLHKMTTKALFYQVVYTDLSKNMLLFNTRQQGFQAVTQQLNMLRELLNRPDAGHVLLELLQKDNPSKIEGEVCLWWDYCLQIIMAQKKVINRMTDEDIDQYINQQIRCHDAIRSLSQENNPNWDYPASVAEIIFGLGNVMIRYEYEPFIQTLEMLPDTNELNWDTQRISEQYALQVIDYVKQFKNR